MKLCAVSDARGEILDLVLLRAAEAVHRELRPHLPADYVQRMHEVFASGAEMVVALDDNNKVLGLSVFRIVEKTFSGRELYCDDLVTAAQSRSGGVGRALIAWLQSVGRERGCDCLALDSGAQRQQAHKFYFREGLTISSFHFTQSLCS